MSHYEVFRDEAGEWRWHLKASNGEIVAQSEGYPSKSNAKRGMEDAQLTASKSEDISADK